MLTSMKIQFDQDRASAPLRAAEFGHVVGNCGRSHKCQVISNGFINGSGLVWFSLRCGFLFQNQNQWQKENQRQAPSSALPMTYGASQNREPM